jgi:hypothetical protein
MHELRNHTPHDITLVLADGTRVTLPPCPPTPRTEVRRDEAGLAGTVHGTVPMTLTRVTGTVLDLPPRTPGVLRIVSRGVAEAVPERDDLVFPDRQVRDERGRVVAAEALGRIIRSGAEPCLGRALVGRLARLLRR